MPTTNDDVQRYLHWLTQPDDGGLESLSTDQRLIEGLEASSGDDDERIDAAFRAVDKLARRAPLDDDERGATEAIIIPGKRPVVDIVNDTYVTPGGEFAHFGDDAVRGTLAAVIPSVGRIELPDHPRVPYGGTGFLVGDGLLMTNRHVAELFANGIGRDGLSFVTGRSAGVDFLQERDRDDSAMFTVANILMVHPFWDLALLAVIGLDGRRPLRLTLEDSASLRGRDVAVIGYPAFDPRNNVDLQNEIFNHTFNVKRLQPGKLRERMDVRSFGHDVSAVSHDSSTLGGNSGSVVLDVTTGLVVGLHFAGRYLEANYAVPSHELAGDGRVVDAGVNFSGDPTPRSTAWDNYWRQADSQPIEASITPSSPAHVSVRTTTGTADPPTGAETTWVVPLEITVRVGAVQPPATAPAVDAAVEKLVEPIHDDNLAGRSGYDEQFLGLPVPLPEVLDQSITSKTDDGDPVLRYEHFSIVVHKHRRLPLFSCSNVDGSPVAKEPEVGRDYSRRGLSGLGDNDREKWFIDPRIPAVHQLPDRFYNKDRQAFDKGHVVRREDAAWGATFDEVRRGNGDTYHTTNCTPQVGDFNRKIWLRLENLVLSSAATERLCVFAGPVLADDDPEFHGVADDGHVVVRIPQQYWKIAVARNAHGLESYAFVLDQDLSGVKLEASLDSSEFPVPAEWRTRMISVGALEQMLGEIRFADAIRDADQFGKEHGEEVVATAGIERYPG